MNPQTGRPEQLSGLRRRRFTAPHRRRSLAVRLLRPFAAALALVVAPLGVAAWVLHAPQFRLREIAVSGTEQVPQQWLSARLEPLVGRHLLRLSLADLEAGLAGHPWVAGVEMHKRLPDGLSVRVIERRPAALLRRSGGLFYVDAAGEVIVPYNPGNGPADLLLVSGGAEQGAQVAAALAAAREFVRVAPAWGVELSEIEVLGEDDMHFYTAALPFALLLGATGIEAGLRRLRHYLPEIRQRFAGAAVLDLRFRGRIVALPATGPQGEER